MLRQVNNELEGLKLDLNDHQEIRNQKGKLETDYQAIAKQCKDQKVFDAFFVLK